MTHNRKSITCEAFTSIYDTFIHTCDVIPCGGFNNMCDSFTFICDTFIHTCDGFLTICDGTNITCDRIVIPCVWVIITCVSFILICDTFIYICDDTSNICDGIIITCDWKKTVRMVKFPIRVIVSLWYVTLLFIRVDPTIRNDFSVKY